MFKNIWCNEAHVIEDILNCNYSKESTSRTDGLSFSETKSGGVPFSMSFPYYRRLNNIHAVSVKCSICENWFHYHYLSICSEKY